MPHPFRGSEAIRSGLLTRAQLRGARWRRLLPDVYLHRDVPLDHHVRCAAVALTLPPGAVIAGLSAAYLWGAELIHPDAPVSVATPRTRRVHRGSAVVPHHTVLAPADRTTIPLPDPTASRPPVVVPVTTPERTAFDLGRRLRRGDALVALDAMSRTGLDLAAVAGLARERRHWPRTAQLDEILRLTDPRAESPMETRMRLLFHDAGLPVPQPQYEVLDSRGRLIARVDLGWPAARVAAEYEGDHHRDRDRYRRDIARVNALRLAGWSVLRFAADDLFRTPRRTVALLSAELSHRTRPSQP
ncbi:DUF559 domain-containing protein [Actinoplanes sp. DH11]|uniref:DUF559 domain-containing protein n=1 Tax=Actinoplanes sp. DH11 TaxID=2857011 RepID=UPI001E350591|nr:DUF559 domain-containing protein [Actinoplanes sp. DH11]